MNLKRVLSFLLALIMIIGLIPVSAAPGESQSVAGSMTAATNDNLFMNGDLNNADFGVGYFRAMYDSSSLTYLADGGVDGTGCIGLNMDPAKTSGNVCLMYSNGAGGYAIPIFPGRTYTMSCDVWKPSGTNGTVEWLNMDFQSPMHDNAGEIKVYTNLYDQWVHLERTFTVPTNRTDMIWRIFGGFSNNNQSSNLIKIDNISLIDVTPYSENLLIGGDMESKFIADTYYTGTYDGGTRTWLPDAGVGGSGCIALSVNPAGKNNALIHSIGNGNPLVEGKTYIISCDIFVPANTVNSYWIDFEGGGTTLNGWEGGLWFPNNYRFGYWQRISSTFTYKPNAFGLRIFGSSCANADTNAKILIDNISLRCTDTTVQSRYAATYNENLKGVNLLYNGDCNREGYSWGRDDWKGAAFTWNAGEGVNGSGAWVGVAGTDATQSGCVMAMPSGMGKQLEAYRLYEFSVKVWRSADCNASTRLEIKTAEDGWLGLAAFASKTEEWETLTYRYWSDANPKNLTAMVITDAGFTTGIVKVDDFAIRELGVDEHFDIVDLESATITDVSNRVATVELTFGAPMWIGGNVLLCDSKNTSGCHAANPEQYQYTTHTLTAVDGVVQGEKTYSAKWVATFKLCGCEQHPELWTYGLPGNCVVRITDWMGSAEATQNKTLDERMVIAANVAEGSNGERIAAEYIDGGMDVAWMPVTNKAPEWAPMGDNLVRSGDFAYEWYTRKDFYPVYGTTVMNWYAEGGVDNSSYVGMVMHEPSDDNKFGCLQYRLDGLSSVELVEDQWYILSCDVYIPTGAADWVAIDFEDDAWNNWAVETLANGYFNRVSTQNAWQHLYMKFKYTDKTSIHSLRVLVAARTAGLEVKIDNVSLQCLSDPTIKPAFDPLPDDLDPSDFPTGTLEMVKAEVISDVEGIITFSEPAVFEEWCFFAVRFLDGKDSLVWRTPDGKYSANGYEIEGSIPMQWSCSWEWYNEEHTQIRFKILGDGTGDMYNFNDLFAVDWTSLVDGGYLAVGFEELGEIMVNNNGYVDNIRLESDPRVALTATRRADRDGAWVKMDVQYTPAKLTYSAVILNETQIRIIFSEPVIIRSNPHVSVRYTDDDNVMIYNEDIYNRFGIQFNGTWEKESSTSYIWTIDGHTHYNTRTLYDVVNFTGGLSQYWKANVRVCIEELDSATFKSGNNNNVIENIATMDGANHLIGNRRSGYDGAYVNLNASELKGDKLTILSVVALNETQVEVTFSSSVAITDGVSMSVRYLTPSGDSETLVDGRTASFKGNWEYKDESKNAIIWTLKSQHVDKLSDIINYNGNFKWNKGARIAFIIVDAEDNQAPPFTMRIKGVTDRNGYLMLEANYAKKEAMMAQADITVDYEVPAPIVVDEESAIETVYVTEYRPVIFGAVVMIGIGVIGMTLLITVRKKEGK